MTTKFDQACNVIHCLLKALDLNGFTPNLTSNLYPVEFDQSNKKVCIRFVPKKSTGGSGNKPSSSRGGNGSHGVFTKATPKKDGKAYCRFPGLQHPSSFTNITTPQWMRDITPPQVSQGLEGLLRQQEEKEEEGCEPCREELSHKACKDGGHR